MTDFTPEADRLFHERVTRYLEDDLPAEQLAELNQELAADATRQKRFVEICLIQSLVAEHLQEAAHKPERVRPAADDDWSAAAALSGATAGPAHRSDHSPSPHRPMRIGTSVGRRLAAAAALLIAAGAAWHFIPKSAPPGARPMAVAVATLSGSRDAAWNGSAVSDGTALVTGTSLNLSRGCVELTFAQNSKVIIEGPARLTVASATGVRLESGKLAAVVAGKHFVVSTPKAVVTDLGTTFGVDVATDGETRVEVFQGAVRVESSTSPGPSPAPTLNAGEAAVATTVVVQDAAGAVPQHFVRSLAPSAVQPIVADVVDLLAGGNGLGHQRGQGFDALTGAPSTVPIAAYVGNHRYATAPRSTVLDGLFTPDQFGQPIWLDSAKHAYAFPPTDNRGFALLWAGGAIPTVAGTPPRPTTLAGVDYASAGHGLLAIDSNKGVTIDLNTLRRLHPEHTPARFRCGVGNSYIGVRRPAPMTDVYVFVDGQLKFQRPGLASADGRIDVDVPLTTGDRFLTLVTTDGGDGAGYDWVLWADPLIDLNAH